MAGKEPFEIFPCLNRMKLKMELAQSICTRPYKFSLEGCPFQIQSDGKNWLGERLLGDREAMEQAYLPSSNSDISKEGTRAKRKPPPPPREAQDKQTSTTKGQKVLLTRELTCAKHRRAAVISELSTNQRKCFITRTEMSSINGQRGKTFYA